MSISFFELVDGIEEIAPSYLAEEWDNTGIQLNCGNDKISKVLVVLEITKAIIEEAIDKKVDAIITHHPLYFSKLNKIDNNDIIGNYTVSLIKAGINVYSSHTSFDSADLGNNAFMAEKIGLEKIKKLRFSPLEPSKLGLKGQFEGGRKLIDIVKEISRNLEIPVEELKIVGEPEEIIEVVGVCTGAGASLLELVAMNKCDLFVTGDIKYHEAQKAKEMGLCLIDAGHYGTEKFFGDAIIPQLEVHFGNEVEFLKSKLNINPIKSMV